MKTLKIIIIQLILFTNISYSQSIKMNNSQKGVKSDLDQKGIKGKVKSLAYYYSKNGEDNQKTVECTFNERGNKDICSKYYLDGDNPDTSTYSYSYDRQGNNIGIKTNDNESFTTIIEGNKHTTKEYKNSKLELTKIEIKDEKGNVLELSLDFYDDERFNSKRVYKYDENQNEISQKVYKGKELSLSVMYRKTFNKFNKIILSERLDSDGEAMRYDKYFYDTNHNLSKIEFIAVFQKIEKKKYTNTFVYNKNNQMIEQRHNPVNSVYFGGYEKTTYQYKNENLIEKKLFNESDKVLEIQKFKYDVFNNEVLHKTQTFKGGNKTETIVLTTVYEYY